MPKINKTGYLRYREDLTSSGIKSYIDQTGRVSTHCSECDNRNCPARAVNRSCMSGETKPTVLHRIKEGRV